MNDLPSEQRLCDLERADQIIAAWLERAKPEQNKVDWVERWGLRHLIAAEIEAAEERGKTLGMVRGE